MIEIIAINKKTGDRIDVSENMYFFEHEYIESINTGDGAYINYTFEIIIDGVMVWPKGTKETRQ